MPFKQSIFWSVLILCLLTIPAVAQDEDTATPEVPEGTCPTLVREAFNATQFACEGIGQNQACIGFGVVEATPVDGIEEFAFSEPGAIATTTDLETLRLRSINTQDSVWTVAQMHLNAKTSSGSITDLNTFVFGDVSITDAAETAEGGVPTTMGTVIATGGINVRRGPSTSETVVWPLTYNEQVVVTGRSADNLWLRIEIPSAFGGPGWVAAQWVELDDEIDILNYATGSSPAPEIVQPDFGQMQAFTFQSSLIDDSCENTPDSGLMMQTPNGLADNARLKINNTIIEFNGTIYLRAQAGDAMLINVLEGIGSVTVQDTTRQAPSGTEVRVPLDVEFLPTEAPSAAVAFNPEAFTALPIDLLSRPFLLVSGEAPATDSAGDTETGSPDTTVATPIAPAQPCTITIPADAGENKNARSGPGVNYPVSSNPPPGSTFTATGRAGDEFNYIWYETTSGDWLRFDIVDSTGDCAELPLVEPPPLPTSAPAATAAPNATSTKKSLLSSEVGDVCASGTASQSRRSDGTTIAITIGGNWTATAGTSASFSSVNNTFRGDYGDYLRIVASDGTILASSGENRTITYTFQADTSFTVEVVAQKEETPILRVTCN